MTIGLTWPDKAAAWSLPIYAPGHDLQVEVRGSGKGMLLLLPRQSAAEKRKIFRSAFVRVYPNGVSGAR